MTKREARMLEERKMLNDLIVDINGRGMALQKMLDSFNRDYKDVKKKLDRHLEKYAKEIAKEDEVRDTDIAGSRETL